MLDVELGCFATLPFVNNFLLGFTWKDRGIGAGASKEGDCCNIGLDRYELIMDKKQALQGLQADSQLQAVGAETPASFV